MALAMLYPGSKGKTANCLSKALCLPKNVETACEELGKLISKMKVRSHLYILLFSLEIFVVYN